MEMTENGNSTSTQTILSAPELESRRLAIITELRSTYRGYEDPDVPESLLRELSEVTTALRRATRSGGPPRIAKRAGKKPHSTFADIFAAATLPGSLREPKATE